MKILRRGTNATNASGERSVTGRQFSMGQEGVPDDDGWWMLAADHLQELSGAGEEEGFGDRSKGTV